MSHWKMSGHVSLATPPGCRVESRTSAILASRGYVCPVGQLQDRRLVLTEPLRNAEYMHVAQRQGGLVELPWGKKNTRLHVIPFLRVPAGFCRSTFSFAVASPDVRGPHVWPVDRPTLQRHKLVAASLLVTLGTGPRMCQPIWRQLFITSQTKMCEMLSNTCRMWRRCFLAFGTRIHHPMNRHFIRNT